MCPDNTYMKNGFLFFTEHNAEKDDCGRNISIHLSEACYFSALKAFWIIMYIFCISISEYFYSLISVLTSASKIQHQSGPYTRAHTQTHTHPNRNSWQRLHQCSHKSTINKIKLLIVSVCVCVCLWLSKCDRAPGFILLTDWQTCEHTHTHTHIHTHTHTHTQTHAHVCG